MSRWRYEGLAEAAAASLSGSGKWIAEDPELLKKQLLHLMEKAYRMGAEDSEEQFRAAMERKVPVQDLTHIPIIAERVKEKWTAESCN